MCMNSHIETINAARAAVLLGCNNLNRPVSKPHVEFLVSEMVSGRFVATGQSIQVAESGELLDGQHRLLALTKAAKEYPFVVVTGLSESIFAKIDQGKKRTSGEALSVYGLSQGTMRAAVGARLILFEAGQNDEPVNLNKRKSVEVVVAYCASHDLDHALTDGHTLHTHGNFFTRTDWAFISEVLTRIDPVLATRFLWQLATGSEMLANDVVLFVRNRIIRTAMNATTRLPAAVKIEYVWAAWNRVREGRRSGMIKLLPDYPVSPR